MSSHHHSSAKSHSSHPSMIERSMSVVHRLTAGERRTLVTMLDGIVANEMTSKTDRARARKLRSMIVA